MEGNDIVHKIEQMKTDPDDRPAERVTIIQSGEVPTPTAFYVSEEPYAYDKDNN